MSWRLSFHGATFSLRKALNAAEFAQLVRDAACAIEARYQSLLLMVLIKMLCPFLLVAVWVVSEGYFMSDEAVLSHGPMN